MIRHNLSPTIIIPFKYYYEFKMYIRCSTSNPLRWPFRPQVAFLQEFVYIVLLLCWSYSIEEDGKAPQTDGVGMGTVSGLYYQMVKKKRCPMDAKVDCELTANIERRLKPIPLYLTYGFDSPLANPGFATASSYIPGVRLLRVLCGNWQLDSTGSGSGLQCNPLRYP